MNSQIVDGIKRFTSRGVEFVDGRSDEFESIILATGYRSNVASWLMVNSESMCNYLLSVLPLISLLLL